MDIGHKIRAGRGPATIAAISALLLQTPLFAQNRGDFCSERAPWAAQQRLAPPDGGRYVNRAYGYSLQVPSEASIFVATAGPQRGFTLRLSEQPLRFIRVDAAYDVFYDISAEGVHQRDVNTLRLHDRLLGDEGEGTNLRLSGEPAARWRLRFSCRENPAELVNESIVAVRYREIYRIDLHTTPQDLESDLRMVNELARSWRWEKPR